MDAFDQEVLNRLPLAEAVWTLLRHVADESLLSQLFERHRGTGSDREVRFALLVELVADALLQHAGSGRQSFQAARETNRLSATDEAVYGKLRRVPLELAEALVRETTRRLRQVLPEDPGGDVPPALRDYRVMVVDGKKLKRLPKRLKALRGVRGKVLGGKVVAGLLLNEGLVVAMHASPDGEANDAPLAPRLVDQCQAEFAGRLLYVADRQFCDLTIPRHIESKEQWFLIRYSKKMLFFAEKERTFCDAQGRAVREAWGWLGSAKDPRRMHLRQITLVRPGEEDVILVTNLLDADEVPAEQLLETYLARWTIERVFQQVTEVFHLERFISTSPQGAVFQFALCVLLYNLIQAIRGYIASLQSRPVRSLSSEMIFRSACDQLTACAVMLPAEPLVTKLPLFQTPQEVRRRLNQLLASQWSALWIKSPPKKKTPPTPQRTIPGGHSSAWKLIAAAKLKPPPS
jgi:hypothetical protein